MNLIANENRLAIVTGGGRGIGEAVCRQLAKSGLRVVVADIDGDSAHRIASSLGKGHAGHAVDVTNEGAVIGMFDEVEAAHGSVAVLVCVAGALILPGGERPLIKDMTLDNWERSFAVNAGGAFICSREYLRRREALPVAQGRVVFFGSVAAQLGGYRSSAAYIGAKSAVLGYAKAFARESAHLSITANAISPGLIDTEMLRSTIGSSGALVAASQNIPLGRIGSVEDVASAVNYLISPAAQYITGSVIDVNGGYRMQ
jgi:NAD(P)-dependent dehydrogenase (short-subunit alcohol dehydrogenase family)